MDDLVKIDARTGLSGPFVYNNEVYFTSFDHTDYHDYFGRRLKSIQYEVHLYRLVGPVGEFGAFLVCRFRYVGKVPVIPNKEDK